MITLKDLSFSYGKHKVLANVSMTLEKGKIYGLLGENGVGKSTLLKILSGLLKMERGECNVFGEVPYRRNPSFLQDIFYLPEDFAGENVVVEISSNSRRFSLTRRITSLASSFVKSSKG